MGVKSILKDIVRFYAAIDHGRLRWIKDRLDELGISIITDFLSNREMIERFHKNYIEPYQPRVAIVGINPGRFGSGKVGIPFLDFGTAGELLGEKGRTDSEKSARFFYSVVSHFGPHQFYSTFHVTNISWLGFTKGGRNINYYRLPGDIQEVIFNRFTSEMALVNPTDIISTSREVQKTLGYLKDRGKIKANIETRLKHPRWCGIDTNREKGFREYIGVLKPYVRGKKRR